MRSVLRVEALRGGDTVNVAAALVSAGFGQVAAAMPEAAVWALWAEAQAWAAEVERDAAGGRHG